MATTMEPTTTVSIRIPHALRDELDALAKSTGRNRNYLAHEALRRFVDREKWQIATVEERLRKADAGEFATDEQMADVWAEFGLDDEGDTSERAVS